MAKSNCLVAALAILRRTEGRLRWWPGWNNGWVDWRHHPWGHFSVLLRSGDILSYKAESKKLRALSQLWFEGKVVRARSSVICDVCCRTVEEYIVVNNSNLSGIVMCAGSKASTCQAPNRIKLKRVTLEP